MKDKPVEMKPKWVVPWRNLYFTPDGPDQMLEKTPDIEVGERCVLKGHSIYRKGGRIYYLENP